MRASPETARRDGRPFRLYARGASAAFLLVAVYTLLAKAPGGELGRDWSHTVLHVVTGVFAVYAGWLAASVTPAKLLTAAVGFAYGILGVVGWFIDGVLMGSSFRIPLAAADNVFHLLLALGAAVALAAGRATSVRAPRASPGAAE
jgi:hypothetical protein